MSSQATGKSLTDRPSNLKEAIDWILRVTWKDGGGGGTDGTDGLANAIRKLPNFKATITAAEKKLREKEGVGVSQGLKYLTES
ncbi:variant erythrocyte surface antigen-1, alpha subunit [Babesia caballi]|uniref:Variant erythrocyte surface antigen-1, alpha subunit n=1 Tax=Babesia caballi TaxID=5871 RepID=A0AAV4LUA3_BABCB|nr:variant erythrocyte surface antigen-1, alpha subunit [Babesia caballi]